MGRLTSHGYLARGKKYEHRIIAANILERELKTSEEVHHFDGKGTNNGNHNLVICTRTFHKYLHFIQRVHSLGYSRKRLAEMHHVEGLPLEEIKRRLGLGEGMIGRWFHRMNIEIRPGVGGRGSKLYKSRVIP